MLGRRWDRGRVEDLLAGAHLLRSRGADRIVAGGREHGRDRGGARRGRADPAVDGVISLSAPTDCCGMTIAPGDLKAIEAPMLFIAGADDGDAPMSARQLARWAGDRGQLVVLNSGEPGSTCSAVSPHRMWTTDERPGPHLPWARRDR